MTDRRSTQPIWERHWLPFKCNVSVPACGVMVLNGAQNTDGQLQLKTKQATTFFNQVLLVNGPTNVAANTAGVCRLASEMPIVVAYNTSGNTPSFGDVVGVQPNTTKVRPNFPGFVALNNGSSGRVLVVQESGVTSYWAKLAANLSSGGSTTAYVWWNHAPANSGYSVTVYDWLLTGSGSLASGDRVKVEYFRHANKAYVTAANC